MFGAFCPLGQFIRHRLQVKHVAKTASLPWLSGTGFQCHFPRSMLLLFIGIHNAWDVVTYTAFERSQPQDNKLAK